MRDGRGAIALLVIVLQLGRGEVVVEDLLVGVATGAHDGGANLAEAHAVTPSGTAKGEGGGNAVGADVVALDGEGRAVEVRVAGNVLPSVAHEVGVGLLAVELQSVGDGGPLVPFLLASAVHAEVIVDVGHRRVDRHLASPRFVGGHVHAVGLRLGAVTVHHVQLERLSKHRGILQVEKNVHCCIVRFWGLFLLMSDTLRAPSASSAAATSIMLYWCDPTMASSVPPQAAATICGRQMVPLNSPRYAPLWP